MKFLDDIINLVDLSIKEDAENLITMGNIIKDGYSEDIDADRVLIAEAHVWISQYQKKLSEQL